MRKPIFLEHRIMQSFALPTFSQPQTTPKLAVKTGHMQRMGTRCWQLLVDQGVPFKDARELAIAIIQFMYLDSSPTHAQKHLINRYHRHICDAKLSSLQF